MKEKNCCIIGGNVSGNKDGTVNLPKLQKIIENTIIDLIENKSVTEFVSGMDLGLETYFAKKVIDYKKTYPNISLTCVIPYETQTEFWAEEERDCYYGIVEKCDKEILLQTKYTDEAIKNKNKYLIENSKFCIIVRQENSDEFLSAVNYLLEKRTNLIGIDPYTLKVTRYRFI